MRATEGSATGVEPAEDGGVVRVARRGTPGRGRSRRGRRRCRSSLAGGWPRSCRADGRDARAAAACRRGRAPSARGAAAGAGRGRRARRCSSSPRPTLAWRSRWARQRGDGEAHAVVVQRVRASRRGSSSRRRCRGSSGAAPRASTSTSAVAVALPPSASCKRSRWSPGQSAQSASNGGERELLLRHEHARLGAREERHEALGQLVEAVGLAALPVAARSPPRPACPGA